MKRIFSLITALCLLVSLLTGCGAEMAAQADTVTIVGTTYPVCYLLERITAGADNLTVSALVEEPVSCLHNYSITTTQMKLLDRADIIVLNGAGMENFLDSALKSVSGSVIIDGSEGLSLFPGEEDESEWDPHYWLDPERFAASAEHISDALSLQFPEDAQLFEENTAQLTADLLNLKTELNAELSDLQCRKLITFHDGFSYFADAFDLTIAAAIEEEEGAEAPAKELRDICNMISGENIPAIFKERNGSDNACTIISQELNLPVYTLNTMMDGETDYMTAMRENAAAVKEALS